MSYHISNLGAFGNGITTDMQGYVPEPGDDWRDMSFDLGPDENPDREGISEAEREERLEYLDRDWWPGVIAAAEAATARAHAALEEWQDENC